MLEEGDIIRIIDEQEYLAQKTLNMYYYRADTVLNPDDAYSQLLSKFFSEVVSAIMPVQTTGIVHTNLHLDNITNNLDFDDLPLSGANGDVTGEAMPTFVAYKFVLHRPTKLTRQGYKRIGGVPESALSGNAIQVAFAPALDGVADKIKICLVIEVGGVEVLRFCPVLVGRNPDGTHDLTRVQEVSEVSWDLRATSQVSRKVRLA